MKRNLLVLLVSLFLFLSCASTAAVLSKTREIFVPELDGPVYVSAIQYAGKSMKLSQSHYINVRDESKRLAILSIQVQNMVRGKVYNFAPIVLLDGDIKITPDALKYFKGNSAFGFDWGIESRNFLNNTLTMSGSGGKYTVNLIYAVGDDSSITRADIFGQIVEFDPELVKLNVIDTFH
ncbi:MAG: hypothetical protein FWD28_01115 [Treponema sp.]|nr:hypothetical protein [Treponema sp.]